MGWISDLYQTYENNKSQIGKIQEKSNGKEYTLLPIGHTTQNAQIEVVVDEDGDFYSAKVVDKEGASTVIPCTEDSFSRTSSPVPHPLHDKLIYIAGDFEDFGGEVKGEKQPYSDYLNQLKEWKDSPYSNRKIRAIYNYISKGTLIEDLVNSKVMYLDQNRNMIKKWNKEITEEYGEKPELFKVINETQDKAFVRFDTYHPGEVNTKVWRDEDMYESFINFYKERLPTEDLCYITGEYKPRAEKHASGLRRAGDNAKLISANDTSGYTYRGRFMKSNDVVSISYDASQKAHNALKWLINKQGKTIDERVFLTWGVENVDVPAPDQDTPSFLASFEGQDEAESDTSDAFSREFNKAMSGYKSDLRYNSPINIIILDAATPGRLSVLYFRNIRHQDYMERIESWHRTCSWLHTYRKKEDKTRIIFKGAPATIDIARVAYGANASDKLIKGTMERLLPCIVDGQQIPLDVVRSAIARASNPVSMEKWEWEKVLSVTCALLNKIYEREEYDVALDTENKNRDYLFGRLLAIADVLERRALNADQKNRSTNAIRYMNAFSMHPLKTWSIIQANLQPYQAKLGGASTFYNRLIDEVATKIDFEDFNDRPLSGRYLLGFYSQRYDLSNWKKGHDKEEIEGGEMNEHINE